MLQPDIENVADIPGILSFLRLKQPEKAVAVVVTAAQDVKTISLSF
jgi:hypothetical protein